ncbi:MAG: signal peptidase II, partial [Clostridia bacterium]|nr:signal peptidase II [Clostridia bacterium]
ITYYVASHHKTVSKWTLIPLSMIAGGGISNVADRFQFGFVVDYIDFRIINYPVFNLADIFVVLGVIWLAVMILKSPEPKKD